MSTSSTISLTLIPTGKSSQRTVIFSTELTRHQMLSSAFTNADIIVGLVSKDTDMEPVMVQKLDAKATLQVFLEGEEVEKICSTLLSTEMWLDHSVKNWIVMLPHLRRC